MVLQRGKCPLMNTVNHKNSVPIMNMGNEPLVRFDELFFVPTLTIEPHFFCLNAVSRLLQDSTVSALGLHHTSGKNYDG